MASVSALSSEVKKDPLQRDKEIALIENVFDTCLLINEKIKTFNRPISGLDCVLNPRLGAQVAAAVPRLIGCQRSGALQIPAVRTIELIASSPRLLKKARKIHGTAGEQLLFYGGSCFGIASEGLIHRLSEETGDSHQKCRRRLNQIAERV